jgi:glycine cleavage system regulatory protein
MTSVLFNAGLNYQNGNPVRLGIEGNRNDILELRKLLDSHTIEINLLKARVTVAEKEAREAKAAAAATATSTAPPSTASTGS